MVGDMGEEKIATQLPRWKCHKEVHAARIVGLDYARGYSLVLEDVGRRCVGEAWFLKHKPSVGGYYVQYADGYESYSPAAAFEEGYTRIGGAK